MPEVQVEESRRFMEESLTAVGVPEEQARLHAALLLHADLTGHFSHGLNRLELYINDIRSGATDPTATPEILKETAATAWVDGRNGLGATVGHFCMDLAARKAKEAGIGFVTVKGSNHFGMAGWWALQAGRAGLVGLAFTNSSPIMVPTRAKESAAGTNPIALCAPANNGDHLLVDMASTAVAMGKIEVQLRRGEPIPEGWALGPDGKPTTDAQLAFNAGMLLPLGGAESTSGYKGYGLSALVEVLCSGMSENEVDFEALILLDDSQIKILILAIGPQAKFKKALAEWKIKQATCTQGPPDLGQCFIAIDPQAFAPGFALRIEENLQRYRTLEPMEPSLPVLAPGDKERMSEEATRQRGAIEYAQQQVDTCRALAQRLGISPLAVV